MNTRVRMGNAIVTMVVNPVAGTSMRWAKTAGNGVDTFGSNRMAY